MTIQELRQRSSALLTSLRGRRRHRTLVDPATTNGPATQWFDRSHRFRVARLRRDLLPPFASVTIMLEGFAPFPPRPRFAVKLDGRLRAKHEWDVSPFDPRRLILDVKAEAFPWWTSLPTRARLEILLDGRVIFAETVRVAPYQVCPRITNLDSNLTLATDVDDHLVEDARIDGGFGEGHRIAV